MSQIVSLLTDAQRESICEDLALLVRERQNRAPDAINGPGSDFDGSPVALQHPLARLLALDVAHEAAQRNAPATPGRKGTDVNT